MRALWFIVAAAVGFCCGDQYPAPDARQEDAPVAPPQNPCCGLLPDQDAVRACAGPFPPGTCGVIACRNADGSFTRINFCGPMPIDAGVP